MSERILSVLVEDKPGVLARVSSTISRRGFNINSLSVGPTNIEGRSKMTIVTELDAVEQVKKQLNKLVNVIKIVDTIDASEFNLETQNLYQYDYQSSKPWKTLPSRDILRVFDQVPVRALCQEVADNRVIYANYIVMRINTEFD